MDVHACVIWARLGRTGLLGSPERKIVIDGNREVRLCQVLRMRRLLFFNIGKNGGNGCSGGHRRRTPWNDSAVIRDKFPYLVVT